MKNSAISSTGNAIASPRYRSFWAADIPSRWTARSPPTSTCAPGTAPRAAVRIESTAIISVIMLEFLRTETAMRLACPSGDRNCGFGLVYVLTAPVT